jgi:hypothetical protein
MMKNTLHSGRGVKGVRPLSDKLSKAFEAGLWEKHSLTLEEIKSWRYCGGWSNPDCIGQYPEYEIFFKQNYPYADFLDPEYECVCGKDIMHNAYIRKDNNASSNSIIIIGSCCVDHFTETKMSRICNKCGNKHKCHYKVGGKLREYNLCSACRKEDLKMDKIYKKNFDAVVYEIKVHAIKKAKAEQEALKKEQDRIAREEYNARKAIVEFEHNHAKDLYFDFPYKSLWRAIIHQYNDEFQINEFTFDTELKVHHCKDTKYFRHWIKSKGHQEMGQFLIADIELFKKKRLSKHRDEYDIKQVMKKHNLTFDLAIAKAKLLGLCYDGIKKVWYKQY